MKKSMLGVILLSIAVTGWQCPFREQTPSRQVTFFCGDGICSVEEEKDQFCPRDCANAQDIQIDFDQKLAEEVVGQWTILQTDGKEETSLTLLFNSDGSLSRPVGSVTKAWGSYAFDGVNVKLQSTDRTELFEGVYGSNLIMKGIWVDLNGDIGGSWTATKDTK
ncbi:MAG: hypothetical protein ABIG66_05040 [Candidatus Kerfeldbacteria bacterium]